MKFTVICVKLDCEPSQCKMVSGYIPAICSDRATGGTVMSACPGMPGTCGCGKWRRKMSEYMESEVGLWKILSIIRYIIL